MPGYLKIILILLFLLYVISPIDFLPDLIPYVGRIDDAVLLGLLLYVLKKGRLPGFLSWLEKLFKPAPGYTGSSQGAREREDSGRSSRSKSGPRNPYEILGLKSNATLDEIHAAYRERVQAYHPDKVSHLGPELQELAQEKFIEIQRAYEELTGKTA